MGPALCQVNQNLKKITGSILWHLGKSFAQTNFPGSSSSRCVFSAFAVSLHCPQITNQWRLIRVKNNSSSTASVTMTSAQRIPNYSRAVVATSCVLQSDASVHFCSNLSGASGGKLSAHGVVLSCWEQPASISHIPFLSHSPTILVSAGRGDNLKED